MYLQHADEIELAIMILLAIIIAYKNTDNAQKEELVRELRECTTSDYKALDKTLSKDNRKGLAKMPGEHIEVLKVVNK